MLNYTVAKYNVHIKDMIYIYYLETKILGCFQLPCSYFDWNGYSNEQF